MSALAGIYCPDGRPVADCDLQSMLASLAHRGADGSGFWNRGAVGLGHRMRWTTHESLQERLPLVDVGEELGLTADAHIDNREELIAACDLHGRSPAAISDSELILAAYRKWGDRCPEQLLGDFAFAIWDGRRQCLFCARDYFGIKPFYYHYQPSRAFAFASEIKALLSLPWVPRRLNEVRVADYLTSLAEDKTMTFYEGILRLPPAHSMTIDTRGVRFQEYWSLDPGRDLRYRSDEDYAQGFREVFTAAVRCRLRSAYPVGVALSGGLDSSSIVGVAQQLVGAHEYPPVHTFSAIFDDVPECDERPFIKAILAQGRVKPHYVHFDRVGALSDIERVLWHQDQPLYIRNMHLWTTMYDAARQQGIRIMLDGEDGDTVVSHGDGYLAELARADRWEAFAREASGLFHQFQNYGASPGYWLRMYGFTYLNELARAGRWIKFARAVKAISQHFDVSRREIFLNQGLRAVAPEPLLQVWRMLRGRGRAQSINKALISPDFAQRIGLQERSRALWQRYTPTHTLREEHWLSLQAGITSCVEEEDDKAAAAFGIVKRHPFWDRRVAEFCLALPPEQKLRWGWSRWILRRAMAGILPEKIRWRVGKSNLGPNFTRSLLTLERQRLEEVLVKDPKVIEGYVDVSVLLRSYSQGDANTVWPAVILALWLQQTGLTA